MTDIVQRLREHDDEYYLHGDTMEIVQEAADLIEAQRALLRELYRSAGELDARRIGFITFDIGDDLWRALATYVESSPATTRASSQESPTQAPSNSEDDGS